MHAELHIHHFRARHRARDDAGLRRCRAVQDALLDGQLEAALADAAGDDEIIVLKRLDLQIRLSAQRSDLDNARRWRDALADALTLALQHTPPAGLQRFADRRHALRSFAIDLIDGDVRRDWVWTRLGFLCSDGASTPQRHDALLRLLADDAEHSVPVLRALLHTAAWHTLVRQLSDAELRGLAQSVLARIGDAPGAGFGPWPPPRPAHAALSGDAATMDSNSLMSASSAVLARVALAGSSVHTPHRRGWALRLAVMLIDPTRARRGAAAVDAMVWACEPDAAGPAPDDVAFDRRVAGDIVSDADDGIDGRVAQDRLEGESTDAQTIDSSGPIAEAESEFGGLLLLLPCLPAAGALALLEDTGTWPVSGAVGGLREALHRFALHLLPMAADDPAALAFCGLPPDAPPPTLDVHRDGRAQAQHVALMHAHESLLALLSTHLPQWPASTLIDRIARRPARIRVEPGWIEVCFALRDVSIDLRRAGLDLDPGFVPWLGAVVKLRYA